MYLFGNLTFKCVQNTWSWPRALQEDPKYFGEKEKRKKNEKMGKLENFSQRTLLAV